MLFKKDFSESKEYSRNKIRKQKLKGRTEGYNLINIPEEEKVNKKIQNTGKKEGWCIRTSSTRLIGTPKGGKSENRGKGMTK